MKLQELFEMQDFRKHSGHREEESDKLKEIGRLDDKLLNYNNNTKAMREWEDYSNNLLPQDDPYWDALEEYDLDDAINTAKQLIDRYNI